MKISYKEMNTEELVNNYTSLKSELFNLRFSHKAGQLTNPIQINTVKKNIARILTELKARNFDANTIKMVVSGSKKTTKKAPAKKVEAKKAEVKKVETKKAEIKTVAKTEETKTVAKKTVAAKKGE